MTQYTAPRRDIPPQEVAAAIDFLIPLSEDLFANRLADVVLCPGSGESAQTVERINDVFGLESSEPIVRDAAQAAFRSEQLVSRSAAAARYLIDHANATMRTREGVDRRTDRRTLAFRDKVGRERRILEDIHKGLKAQKGILDTSPNPLRRAKDDLWQLALQGDVPAGTARRLLEERKEEVVERKREQKRQAKERARQGNAAMSG